MTKQDLTGIALLHLLRLKEKERDELGNALIEHLVQQGYNRDDAESWVWDFAYDDRPYSQLLQKVTK